MKAAPFKILPAAVLCAVLILPSHSFALRAEHAESGLVEGGLEEALSAGGSTPLTTGLEESGGTKVREFRAALEQQGLELHHVPPEVLTEPDLWRQLDRLLKEPGRIQERARSLSAGDVEKVQIGWGLELHRKKFRRPRERIAVDMVIPPAGREAPFQDYLQFAQRLLEVSDEKVTAVRLSPEGIKFQHPDPEGSGRVLWSHDSRVWEIPQGLLEFLQDRALTISLEVPPIDRRSDLALQWAWILDPRTLYTHAPAEGGTEQWSKPFPLLRPDGQALSLLGYVDDERQLGADASVVPARFVILAGTSSEEPWVYEKGIHRLTEGKYRLDLSRYPESHPVRRFLDLLVQRQIHSCGLQGGAAIALLRSRSLKDLDVVFVLPRIGAVRFMDDDSYREERVQPLAKTLNLSDPRLLFPGYAQAQKSAATFEGKTVEVLPQAVVEESGAYPYEPDFASALLSITRMVIVPDWQQVQEGDVRATHALILDHYGGLPDLFEKRVRLIGSATLASFSLEQAIPLVFRIIERMALEGLKISDAEQETSHSLVQLQELLERYAQADNLASKRSLPEDLHQRLRKLFQKVHPSGPAALQLLEEFGIKQITQRLGIVPEQIYREVEDRLFQTGLEERVPWWLKGLVSPEELEQWVYRGHEVLLGSQPVAVLFDSGLVPGEKDSDREELLMEMEGYIRSLFVLPEEVRFRIGLRSAKGDWEEEGFRMIEVVRHPEARPGPLPIGALPLVVTEALASPDSLFTTDPLTYADLTGLTLPEVLAKLTDLFA